VTSPNKINESSHTGQSMCHTTAQTAQHTKYNNTQTNTKIHTKIETSINTKVKYKYTIAIIRKVTAICAHKKINLKKISTEKY